MQTRLSCTSIAFLLGITLLFTAQLFAQAGESLRDQLYAKAMAAGANNDPKTASELFCQLENRYPTYKDVKMQCLMWSNEFNEMVKRSKQYYLQATLQLQENRCEEAKLTLDKVKTGPHAKASELSAIIADCYFERGVKAVQSGKYDSALLAFADVCCGSHASEAQTYINETIPRIQKYDEEFAQAERLLQYGKQRLSIELVHQADQVFQRVQGGSHAEQARNYHENMVPEWFYLLGVESFNQAESHKDAAAFEITAISVSLNW